MCQHLGVRDALVVLFWLWVVVALCVYGYRLYRRLSGGGRSREGAGGDDTTTTGAPRRLVGRRSEPPLPEGPLEPRLPRSLQQPGAAAAGPSSGGLADPSSKSADTGGDGAATGATAPGDTPPPRPVTVAEALSGIQLPDGLLPLVEADDLGAPDGRTARFSATGTSGSAVAGELATELQRIGYDVDGPTPGADGTRLRCARRGTTVTGTVVEDDDGRVVVELRV